MSEIKDSTGKHQAGQNRSVASRPPGVSKSPVGFGISLALMVGWLLFIAYLALKLGQ